MFVSLQKPKFYFMFSFIILVVSNVSNVVGIEVCRTEACYKAGNWLASSVNAKIHPCTDFYKYACGQWSTDHPANKTVQIISHATFMKLQIDQSIGELLFNQARQQQPGKVIKSIQYAKSLYRECLNEGKHF